MEAITTPLEKFIQFLPYVIPLVLLQLILMIVALVDLSKREKVRWFPKWLWVIFIVLGELLGPAVYLIAGRED